MKSSFLKTGSTHSKEYINPSTGEVLGVSINKSEYLANSKEEFWMVFASFVLILKDSSDVKIKLFAALLDRYSDGREFSLTGGLKNIIGREVICSPRSLDNALSTLVQIKAVIRLERSIYRINPRHIFKGGLEKRNNKLKAVLQLECPEC